MPKISAHLIWKLQFLHMKRFICVRAATVSFQDLIIPVSAWVASLEAYSYWSCMERRTWCYWHIYLVCPWKICGSRIVIPLWYRDRYSAVVNCIVSDHCSSLLETFCTYTTDVSIKAWDMSEAVCCTMLSYDWTCALQKTDVMNRHRSCHNQCSPKACGKKHLLRPAFTCFLITTNIKCMSLSHQYQHTCEQDCWTWREGESLREILREYILSPWNTYATTEHSHTVPSTECVVILWDHQMLMLCSVKYRVSGVLF
jgi:hypothetical protein